MKKKSSLLLLLCAFTFCIAQEKTTYTNERGDLHLCGPFEINELKEDSLYAAWFNKRYDEFTLEGKNYSWSNKLKDIEVEIYLGTWCGFEVMPRKDFPLGISKCQGRHKRLLAHRLRQSQSHKFEIRAAHRFASNQRNTGCPLLQNDLRRANPIGVKKNRDAVRREPQPPVRRVDVVEGLARSRNREQQQNAHPESGPKKSQVHEPQIYKVAIRQAVCLS